MFAPFAFADSISVTNEVHLKASSGGNSSNGGTIHTGSVSASVDIANDEPNQDVHTYISTTTESSIHIDIQNGRNGSDGANGSDGEDGTDGMDGVPGKDGVSGEKSQPIVHTHPIIKNPTTATSSAPLHASSSNAAAILAVKEEETKSITHSIHLFFEAVTNYVWYFFTK